MAKFNVEVDLDWLDEDTTIDEEIRERVIRGAEDYLLRTTTEEIEKKIDNLVGQKLKEVSTKIDEIVDGYLDVVCQSEIEKMKMPTKETEWVREVKMIPIQEFVGIKFDSFCNEKRYDRELYLKNVLSKQVSDVVKKAQQNAEKEIIGIRLNKR